VKPSPDPAPSYAPPAAAPVDDATRLRALLHAYMLDRESTEAALAASEARYRALIARAAYGIYRSTPAGRFVEVNPALVAMLGWESTAALLAADLARDVWADGGEERERLVRAVEAEDPPDWIVARWKRRDGSPIVVRLSVRAARDAHGMPVELEGMVEDVTARVRQDELLRRSERMASLGTLLAGVAHEINNPLAAVAGFAQLLMRSPLSADDLHAVETIAHEASRAGKIVRDLLTFARQGERERREPVRINEAVRHIVLAQRYAMETRGIHWSLVLEPADPLVLGDRAQLEQVVLNLVVNARQAIEDMGDAAPSGNALLPMEVAVETRAEGSEVLLVVRDTGPGIAESDRSRIFDPFFTTKAEGRGTGLGLSVVDGIVSEHGGSIEVDSAPGTGSVFTVRLAREAEPPAQEQSATLPVRPLDVLVVDDEESMLGFLARYLGSRGHAVVAARSGTEAMALARSGGFDVCVCDLRMPSMDGVELVRRLRQLPDGQRMRIVISTGESASSPLREQALGLGDVVVIEKPYDVGVLRRAVEHLAPPA
jgi:two-component system, cell cycle sensor histidine kinase and response regulator CckA